MPLPHHYPSQLCGVPALLKVFLRVCKLLGIPVAMDKVEGPATLIVFLGLKLDSVKQQIRLLLDKLEAILKELGEWQQRDKATKCQLPSLIGKLSFAAKAIPADRLFTRRLINLSTKVKRLHHRIRLDQEAQACRHPLVAVIPPILE